MDRAHVGVGDTRQSDFTSRQSARGPPASTVAQISRVFLVATAYDMVESRSLVLLYGLMQAEEKALRVGIVEHTLQRLSGSGSARS